MDKKILSLEELQVETINLLAERGVTIGDIASLVYEIQAQYLDNLTLEICERAVESVLEKREVIHAVITGISLDILAEKKMLPQPLLDIVARDEGLYGIDEIIPLAIVNLYGSIGFTNYGYLDKVKIGILGELDKKTEDNVNTFLDDLIAAIAAAAASKIAHSRYE